MPEVARHPEGAPCWTELAADDLESATHFYGQLLGWEDDPQPTGPLSFYHIQRIGGLEVAGIYGRGPEQRLLGVLPHWLIYFSVADADRAVRRAEQAGGEVLVGTVEVGDTGRAAMVQDPQGAVFALWEAGTHIGHRVVCEPGAYAWSELLTSNLRGAVEFYTVVLGVVPAGPFGSSGRVSLRSEGKDTAGIAQTEVGALPVPAVWLVHFHVGEVHSGVARARALGAGLLAGPTNLPDVGLLATLQDPQGAVFGLLQPRSA